jgi:hypothetical protein
MKVSTSKWEHKIKPLEMYDIIRKEAKRLGKLTEFTAEFGTRQEYAVKIGEAN